MRRKGLAPLLFIIVVTVGLLGSAFAQQWAPFLGLDLQGGVSVVLQPDGEATDEQLDDAVSIIRSRVDALGVAEPEITRQGRTIVVEIPGVEDPDAAVELVGRTGELRFRPVLAVLAPGAPVPGGADGFDLEGLDLEGLDLEGLDLEGLDVEVLDGVTSPDPTELPGDEQGALGPLGRSGEAATGTQDTDAPVVTEVPPPEQDGEAVEPTDIGPGVIDDPDAITPDMFDPEIQAMLEGLDAGNEITAPEDDVADQIVVLPEYRVIEGQRVEVARYRLGPAVLTGAGLESARASLGGPTASEWVVNPVFRGGDQGIGAFNRLAAECFNQSPTCPTGQAAVTIDGEVVSAPRIQTPSFDRDRVEITGSPFTEAEARELATVLRYGALPVELEIEIRQQVSSSLGRDALEAGLIAGAIGLALVTLYMMAFYRLLGLAAILSLVISGALLWSIIAWLGSTQGLALTLAGITGIIVSIGVSLDSNVVYFETVKSDIREGRTARSAAERSFIGAWRTIVKADVATLIAAVLLYALAVGPVRGFAFYLGLATLIDLFATWFFVRPAVGMMLRSSLCGRRPALFGVPHTGGVVPPGDGDPPTSDSRRGRRAPTDPATTGAV